ncbi:MAG TPA: 30S ribosomal protein S16 [bacterium]|nr:30S ribosomal protein S16 [bacterium]HQG45107.1 30S ribosomal protein S16 [bacterium]HQI47089.1 30S ribosomal protein S16 [bacterium]HQJ65354.1 30S ribosomal protein S16 [bacterium]
MSVKLRLSRIGKKKQPYYRIVAIDSKSSRDGSYLDKIGHYNPVTQPATLTIDRAKALQWLNNGAIPSDTVNSLFRRQGILHEWDLRKRGISDEQVTEEMGKWQDAQIQRGKREEAKNAMAKRETEAQKPAKSAAGAEIKATVGTPAPAAEAEAPVEAAAPVAEADIVVEESAPAAAETASDAAESTEPKSEA